MDEETKVSLLKRIGRLSASPADIERTVFTICGSYRPAAVHGQKWPPKASHLRKALIEALRHQIPIGIDWGITIESVPLQAHDVEVAFNKDPNHYAVEIIIRDATKDPLTRAAAIVSEVIDGV